MRSLRWSPAAALIATAQAGLFAATNLSDDLRLLVAAWVLAGPVVLLWPFVVWIPLWVGLLVGGEPLAMAAAIATLWVLLYGQVLFGLRLAGRCRARLCDAS